MGLLSLGQPLWLSPWLCSARGFDVEPCEVLQLRRELLRRGSRHELTLHLRLCRPWLPHSMPRLLPWWAAALGDRQGGAWTLGVIGTFPRLPSRCLEPDPRTSKMVAVHLSLTLLSAVKVQ